METRSEADDVLLLRGIAQGDEESFRLFFRRWSPRLGRFLERAGGSREVGEDLLQEAFLRVIRAAPSFQPRGSVGAWLHRICANLAYSHWRREARSPFAREEELAIEDALAPSRTRPDRVRAGRALRRDAAGILAGMPENQRLAFLLKAEAGLTYEEVAEVLRCPVGTAKSRFHLALVRLRDGLQAWDPRIDSRERVRR